VTPPLVTIGVVSYNRLRYLRALMESARRCVLYPNVQWIVVDGESVEPGLREYVESLEFVQHKLFEPCTHPEAMNRIVELARGEYLMILPEDVQFVLRGEWLADMVEVAARPFVGHVQFDAQRRQTLARYFGRWRPTLRGRAVPTPPVRRRYRRLRTARGVDYLGFGRLREPIGASGIVSFGRTEIRQLLGPWRTRPELASMQDSGLGAERDMLARYGKAGLRLEAFMRRFPVVADIVTDPRGTKGRVRFGNRRYGRYAGPVGGDLYYRIRDESELEPFRDADPAPAFEDYVEPIGFELPLDPDGNLLKTNVIDEHEPFELIG
jgi:glycosyltransferase involved in cell wall biosynthesis